MRSTPAPLSKLANARKKEIPYSLIRNCWVVDNYYRQETKISQSKCMPALYIWLALLGAVQGRQSVAGWHAPVWPCLGINITDHFWCAMRDGLSRCVQIFESYLPFPQFDLMHWLIITSIKSCMRLKRLDSDYIAKLRFSSRKLLWLLRLAGACCDFQIKMTFNVYFKWPHNFWSWAWLGLVSVLHRLTESGKHARTNHRPGLY